MVFANSHIEISQLVILTLWIICIPFLREMSLMQMRISLWCFERLLAVIFCELSFFEFLINGAPAEKMVPPPPEKILPPSLLPPLKNTSPLSKNTVPGKQKPQNVCSSVNLQIYPI